MCWEDLVELVDSATAHLAPWHSAGNYVFEDGVQDQGEDGVQLTAS